MKKYLVIWGFDSFEFIQSEVETDADPYLLTAEDWMLLAAQSEEIKVNSEDSWDLYCVIDNPTYFYQ